MDPEPPADEAPASPDDELVLLTGHPGVPTRSSVTLAILGVVVAGLFGALIGWGLVDVGQDDASGSLLVLGAGVGALVAAGGVTVVAVLVLRAMVEWRRNPPKLDEPGR